MHRLSTDAFIHCVNLFICSMQSYNQGYNQDYNQDYNQSNYNQGNYNQGSYNYSNYNQYPGYGQGYSDNQASGYNQQQSYNQQYQQVRPSVSPSSRLLTCACILGHIYDP